MERIAYSPEIIEVSRKFKEHNDCTVKAWVNCFDCSYEKAHAWLKRFGRQNRRGPTMDKLQAALESCKIAKVRIGPYSRGNRITLSNFCKTHNKGRYYVVVRGHALCVKDGVVYDHSDGFRRQVIFAARVYLEGEL